MPVINPKTEQEWKKLRKEYITGTDAALIAEERYSDLIYRKLHDNEEEDNNHFLVGRLKEPYLKSAYKHFVGESSKIRMNNMAFWVCDDLHFAGCTPDAFANVNGESVLVEFKNAGFTAKKWNDGIPINVLGQIAWQMLVTGRKKTHVVAELFGSDLKFFEVTENDVSELTGWLITKASKLFPVIKGQREPEDWMLQNNKEFGFKLMMEKISPESAVTITDVPENKEQREILSKLNEWADVKENLKKLTEREKEIRFYVTDYMLKNKAKTIYSPSGTVSVVTANRTRTDWISLCQTYGISREIIESFTEKSSNRYLRFDQNK